mmetsp:Transcript_60312/g.131999  ORF Transcript_60312/g.131999 Transcript_60312/m.131999 type:complete len:371 (-) Transcript_60312:26-1138(-)
MRSARAGQTTGSSLLSHQSQSDEESQHSSISIDDDFEWPNMELDADTFGLSVVSLVRDFYFLSRGKGTFVNRWSRLLMSIFLLATCLTIQIYLLSQVKRFVSAKAVHDVRLDYDKFEQVMYGGHTEVISDHPFVERRGLGGYFNASNFAQLSSDEQANACRIPLSQPLFFWTVLFIWTLTCTAELRKARDLVWSLLLNTEATHSMRHALKDEDDIPGGPAVIVALTMPVKTAIATMVIVPRLGITFYLIWIGCRWLLATNNFADLILNSVALEFILCLKDIMYLALVPRRSMLDLQNTTVVPLKKREPESLKVFIGTLLWAGVAAGWVTLYMGLRISEDYHINGLQKVLVDYRWDVHEVCLQWITDRYAL